MNDDMRARVLRIALEVLALLMVVAELVIERLVAKKDEPR